MPVYPPERLKLIYNPLAGRAVANPGLLAEILNELQTLNFIPEVHIIQAQGDLNQVIAEALRRKTRTFLVCGGDGTIETVASQLIGKPASLAIIPGGTQNNIALSLGIPSEIKDALRLLREGARKKIDTGLARTSQGELPFLELCSIGLFSALFQSADNLQKGDLASLGDLISTLASFPMAEFELLTGGRLAEPIHLSGHAVMISNLPYAGANYLLAPDSKYDDGLLDVLVFSDFSKLELMGNLLQSNAEAAPDDRLRRFRVKKLRVRTQPAMPALADGFPLGDTPVSIRVIHKSLSVITGLTAQPRLSSQPWSLLRNINLLRFFKR